MKRTGNTYLDMSKRSYQWAEENFKLKDEDESILNLVGYLLQQSCELCLKYVLEINGVHFPKTNDIRVLLHTYEDYNLDYGINEELFNDLLLRADMLTKFYIKNKYEKDFLADNVEISIGFDIVKRLLDSADLYESALKLEDK